MRIPQEWKVVGTAALGSALGPAAILVFSAGIFIKPLEQEFGWTRGQVSVGVSIVHFAILFLSVAQGYLVDRWGTRRLTLPSIPLFALGVAAYGFLPNSLATFYALSVIVPVLAIGLWQTAYLHVVSGWFDRRLGLAVGITNAGIGIGGMIIPLVGGFLIAEIGWRATYWTLAGIVLCVSFPMAVLFLRDAPATLLPKAAKVSVSLMVLLRSRDFQWLIGAFLLFGAINGAAIVHQVPMLIDAGWTPQHAALAQGLFGACHITGRLFAGWLLDRVHPPRVMIAFLMLALGASVIDALDAPGDIALVAACGFGFMIGAELDVLAVMVRRIFGVASFGRVYGTIFATSQIGGILSISLLGQLRQMTGSYVAAMWGMAAACVIVALIFTRFRSVPASTAPVAA